MAYPHEVAWIVIVCLVISSFGFYSGGRAEETTVHSEMRDMLAAPVMYGWGILYQLTGAYVYSRFLPVTAQVISPFVLFSFAAVSSLLLAGRAARYFACHRKIIRSR